MAQTAAQKAAAAEAARQAALQKQSAQAAAKVAGLTAAAKAQELADLTSKIAVKVGTTDAAATAKEAQTKATSIANTANTLKPKTITNTVINADGTRTVIYSDGTYATIGTPQKILTEDDITTAINTAMDAFAAKQLAANKIANQANVTTALEDFRANLKLAGLDSLADTIDGYIKADKTAAQIKIDLVGTEAYKERFPGMAALSKAGQAINEATYISMEKGYMQTLAAYGLDSKAFGSRKELGTYIANLVSPREFEERVNLAATRVKDNADVVAQFKTYYPEVDNSALTAYLLNPTIGMDIIKKQVRLAEIGAAALDVGFATGVSLSTAEELRGAVGEQDYQTVRSAFGQAKLLSDQQSRLARIEGTGYSQNEAIQGIVGRDIPSQMASQKRAERETMTRFGGRSGVTSTSLSSTAGI